MIYIVGNKGNMGTRYQRCLDYLGVSHRGHDIGEPEDLEALSYCGGIILATPTRQHVADIVHYLQYDKQIMCEKPISTDGQIEKLTMNFPEVKGLVTMVNQYKYMVEHMSGQISSYDYFKTGGDGLAWDCINIIGLSKTHPILDDKSPIWRCTINGDVLTQSDLDKGYVRMLKDWLLGGESNWDYAVKAHRKVEEWIFSKS